MNRTQYQRLSRERVEDAETLFSAGRWSGAYYLVGYSVECALKACIAKLTMRHEFPDKDRVLRSYTHKIETLVELAGLKSDRDKVSAANAVFERHWGLVKDWDEKARYRIWSQAETRKLHLAVTDPEAGVLPWIMVRW